MTDSNSSPRVAFQGERGAFSEEAAVHLLGEGIQLVPRPTFEALYSAVKEDAADYVLAPLENSLSGSIHRSYDLLLESGLRIQGEVVIPIAHHLIGPPGASFERVVQVQSHPVALAQCERFFNDHSSLKRVPAEDTAGSVREVVHAGDTSCAAIAGRRAAQVYGGCILKEHLEDHRENYTRFLLLAVSDNVRAGADKLSLVVHLAHRPGSLHDALAVFAWRDINLLKIESRPIPGRPWQYRFYLDLHASLSDPRAVAALQELHHFVDDMKILGCYPQAQPVPQPQEIAAAKKSGKV